MKSKKDKFVWLVGGVGLLVFGLAVVSFALSFVAVSERADVVGMTGWLFVLMVDGAIVVFSVLRLVSGLRGYRGLSWALVFAIVFATVLSVWFNVGDGKADIQAVVMHSLPPVFLLVSFEALMLFIHEESKYQTLVGNLQSLIKQIAAKQTEMETAVKEKQTELQTVLAEIATARQTLAQTSIEIERAELKRDRMTLTAVQKQILDFLAKNTGIFSYQELADAMNQPKGTIYKPTKQLIDAGLVYKNGHGYEVAE